MSSRNPIRNRYHHLREIGVLGVFVYGVTAGLQVNAAIPTANGRAIALSEQLDSIRLRVESLEENLSDSLQENQAASVNIQSMRALIRLQAQEAELGKKRLAELEQTVNELEQRKVLLSEKIHLEQKAVRQALASIHRSVHEAPRSLRLPEGEELEAPRRRVLGNIVGRGLREIEVLGIDLEDAKNLETRIADEKRQLDWLFHDLEERRGILELNRSIQADLLKKRQADRLVQLENYRKLKSAESDVSRLIQDFNARKELEKSVATEREVRKSLAASDFEKLQGRLPLPVEGARLASSFGRNFDQSSGLQVFRKGIELITPAAAVVKTVHAGKIAFSGEMPGFGRITIVDHGSHFYTLYGRLGEFVRKEGTFVAAGDIIGKTDAAGGNLYFEVRARNLPVNPAQWVALGQSIPRNVASN